MLQWFEQRTTLPNGWRSEGLTVPTILVADDNSNIQKMVSLAFQEKGIRVVAVGNGEAACRKVPEVRPDVVLADVFMPVRNGYEVCEFVKQDPEFAGTPVILLVGAFDPLDEKEAARVGADGVLKKPFVPPDPLISLVSSLLGKDMHAEPEAQVQEPAPAPVHPELRNTQYTTPRPEPPRPPQEFAFGSDGDDAVETVATSSAPAATPVSAPQEVENIDDDELGPENAWAQRRKAMDYEIDAADSADLVERLAGTKSGREKTPPEEDEILASNKHLPFGGANVPEAAPVPKWADFLKPKAENVAPAPAELPAEAPVAPEPPAPAESYSYDATPPDLEMPSSKPEIAGALAPSELLSSGDDVIPFRPPTKSHAENNSPEESAETQVEAESSSNVFEISAPPESESPELEIEGSAPAPWFQAASESSSKAPVSEPEPSIAPTENDTQEIASSGSTAEVTYGAATEEIESSVVEEHAAQASPTEEIAADSPNADDGLVDDMVARVISKLEPQLHQALKDGVLKPLVQELLNEKRGKK